MVQYNTHPMVPVSMDCNCRAWELINDYERYNEQHVFEREFKLTFPLWY